MDWLRGRCIVKLGRRTLLADHRSTRTQRYGGQPCTVPDCGDETTSTVHSSFPYQSASETILQRVEGASTMTERFAKCSPLGRGARSSYLPGIAWRGRLVDGSAQPQACDEGNGVGQPAPTVETFQRRIGAIRHGHDLALWPDELYMMTTL